MKLIKIGSLFSKISKPKKISRIKSPSSISSSSSSSSSEAITPKSVLPDLFSFSKISKRELEAVIRRLGPPDDPPSEEELASMVAEIDRDDPPAGDELRDAFAVFDADGDGKISAEELLEIFVALGDGECTIDDCRRMIVGVDTDGDGFVCFGDFERMMEGKR